MRVCKGIVKGQVMLLEGGVQLPEGAAVEVRVLERPLTRPEVFARVRATASCVRWGWRRSWKTTYGSARSIRTRG